MAIDLLIVLILLSLAGIFAGLTLAFFSLRLTTLEAKVRTGDRQAARVYGLRKKGNLLLCTLLLGNVASYTIMSIFMGSLTTGLIAGITATGLIFVFAEILPQAVFPRHAMIVCDRFTWLVWICLAVFYPVSAPMAWILDRLLGKETPVLWSKEELGEIISLHEEAGDGIIDRDEERIVRGALSFSDRTADHVMIPKSEVFYIGKNDKLDSYLLNSVRNSGYHRIPVFDPATGRIAGMLDASQLINIGSDISLPELYERTVLISIKADKPLDDLLNLMIERGIHIAVVTNNEGLFRGIVTLEDIMEEILRLEIEEER
jgi:metal transporter CNNM